MTGRASSTESAETAQASLSRLLTVRELADLLRVPVKTIYTWRYKGIGPPAVPVGRYLRFRVEDVATWLDARVDPARFTARRDARRRWASGKRAEPPDQSFYRVSRGRIGHRRALRSGLAWTNVLAASGGGALGAQVARCGLP